MSYFLFYVYFFFFFLIHGCLLLIVQFSACLSDPVFDFSELVSVGGIPVILTYYLIRKKKAL